ncbi:MAG: KH domain-containing protein [Verrucomicrobiaceae bacterium]|nr:KH domain-containing protein [Verrucomicrobiaceae bacterium]
MDAPEALLEFLSYVVANLIEHPQQASIAIGHNSSGTVSYRVQLAPDDVRRVIGRNGMTVSSIRSLLNVAAQKHGLKISLKVGAARDLEVEETVEEEARREAEQAGRAEE